MSGLSNAIQLIRVGQKQEARQILEPLLKMEPANIQAWFWYVETCSTNEKRIQVLEMCLTKNPENSQVVQALQTLRNQQPSIKPFAPLPVQSPKPVTSQPQQTSFPSNAAIYDEEPINSAPAYGQSYFDEKPEDFPKKMVSQEQPSSGKPKRAWEEDIHSYVDTYTLSKPKSAVKSYAFYDVWLTVLASFDIESYESVLNDPEAGAGRGFEWIAYTGIISGLLAPFSLMGNPQFSELMAMPEIQGLFGNMGTTAFMVIMALVLALLTPIISVIGLAVSAGIQNFFALMFGGNGTYGRTAYALAAYLAPMTILIAALGVIPLVGQCATSLLGLYNIVLNVRALRAAHSISIWQALGVMFAPAMMMLIFGCVFVLIVGLPGLSN